MRVFDEAAVSNTVRTKTQTRPELVTKSAELLGVFPGSSMLAQVKDFCGKKGKGVTSVTS